MEFGVWGQGLKVKGARLAPATRGGASPPRARTEARNLSQSLCYQDGRVLGWRAGGSGHGPLGSMSGVRVSTSQFRVDFSVAGFRESVLGFGFRVSGFEFRVSGCSDEQGFGFRVSGFGLL